MVVPTTDAATAPAALPLREGERGDMGGLGDVPGLADPGE
jgi:hypothetical protein